MKDSTEIAIVTGGGRGIGNAIVNRLLSDGARVVTCGRGVNRPEGLDDRVHYIQADVAKPEDARRLVAKAIALGRLTSLVNNAGVQVEKTVTGSTDEDWQDVIDINCRGVFNMCRAALPALAEAKGAIVNIGSVAGNLAEPGMALYNASKAFVHSLTQSIAVDHGPQVRCNAVSPGWILTELTESAFAVSDDPARAKADAIARHAVQRFGDPEDVANAVSWLLSTEAAFVTGQCLTVDGGLTMASAIRPDFF